MAHIKILKHQLKTKLLICLVLILLTLIVYWQTGTFEFTSYDDDFFVTDNPVVQQGLSKQNFLWVFTAVTAGTWQPLTWLSHMLDCQLFGLNAGPHHLVNVFYHLVNTLLLFLVLNKLTRSLWRSAAVAALFALHPLHVESVAWVAERRDVLSTFWWLLTMLAYASWVVDRTALKYGVIVLCFTAGLMAKPMLVTLPIILLFLDIWPLQRFQISGMRDLWRQRRTVTALFVEKIPLLAIALLNGIVTIMAVDKNGDFGSLAQYPMLFRLENGLVSYCRYLFQTFWPIGLVPYYPYPDHIYLWQSSCAVVLLLLVSFYCLRSIGNKPYLLVGWSWFIVSLLPVIGFIQQGSGFALADRYTYVPLIGVFIMLVWGSGAVVSSRERLLLRPVAGLTGLILLACLILSYRQTSHWRNSGVLFNHTLAVDQSNRVALNQLGVAARDHGDIAEAQMFLEKAVELYPNDFTAQVHLAKLYDDMGRYGDVTQHLLLAQRIYPNNPGVYINLGVNKAKQGDFAGAVAQFGKALELRPMDQTVRLNLAFAQLQQKKFKDAELLFCQVITFGVNLPEAYNGLGLLYMEQERFEESIRSFQAALQLAPGSQLFEGNLQTAMDRQKLRQNSK